MRYLLLALSVLGLAACEPPAVQSRRGVGFQDYNAYQQQQAFLARSRVRAAARTEAIASAPEAETATASEAMPVVADAAEPAIMPARRAQARAAAPAQAADTIGADTIAALRLNDSAQRDAAPAVSAPLSALSAEATGLAPAPPVPSATVAVANVGSNIVAYALATSHPVGQRLHRRSNILAGARFRNACARYSSDGLAQEAFLARGGPRRDPLGLDPDGDGYACNWDPAPFRNIRG